MSHQHKEAPSARRSAADRPANTRDHSGSTGKEHPIRIQGCRLQQIHVICSHNKAEKPKVDAPSKGSAVQCGECNHVQEGTDSRMLVIRSLSLRNNATAGNAIIRSETKPVLGVVPSGLTHTESQNLNILHGAIKATVEYKYGSPKDGDKILFQAAADSICSKHPLWTIADRGEVVATFRGDHFDYYFLPPVPDQSLLNRLFKARWLKDIAHRTYTVTCKTCKGSDALEPIEVHVYPNVSSTATYNFGDPEKSEKLPKQGHTLSELMHQFASRLVLIYEEFGIDPHDYIDPPRGEIKFENFWKEDSKSRTAFWGGSFAVGLNPALGLKFNITLVPALAVLKWLPKCVKKYATVDVYVEVIGGFNVNAKLEWQIKAGKTHVFGDEKGAVGGELKLEVGGKAWVGKNRKREEDAVIFATIHANTSVSADAGIALTDEAEIEIDGVITWSGIGVTAAIRFYHGTYDDSVTWQKWDEKKHKFGPHVFFKHESPDERPEDSG